MTRAFTTEAPRTETLKGSPPVGWRLPAALHASMVNDASCRTIAACSPLPDTQHLSTEVCGPMNVGTGSAGGGARGSGASISAGFSKTFFAPFIKAGS